MQEIAYSFKEDITDIKYTESFVVAYEQDDLVGVLGFDADLQNNSAEIWGPFVKQWNGSFQLWQEMIKLLPAEIDSISMFPSKRNVRLQSFAEGLGFNQQSKQTILIMPANKPLHGLIRIESVYY